MVVIFRSLPGLLLLKCAIAAFDSLVARTSVWLAAATYCETSTYLSRTYKGSSEGFIASYVIDNPEKDVQGLIGYMPSQNSIYVAFRGSTSREDWLGNIRVGFAEYTHCDECEVHNGFYDAEQSVLTDVITKVRGLQQTYPTAPVVVTGHSLGGAMATLIAIDLVASGITPVRMFNFGSPRVGNDEFSAWASTYLTDRNRITYYKDNVPHLPSDVRFRHISGEWYEDENHVIHPCVGYEDPTCAEQFLLVETNMDYHSTYLSLDMSCEGASPV